MSRYTLGPACGGEPPYCWVYNRGQAYAVIFGPNIAVAEETAAALVALLNREAAQPDFRWLDDPAPPHRMPALCYRDPRAFQAIFDTVRK